MHLNKRLIAVLACAGFPAAVLPSWAAAQSGGLPSTVPGAGELLRDQQEPIKSITPSAPSPSPLEIPAPANTVPMTDQVRFVLTDVVFSGNRKVDNQTLQNLVKDSLNKQVSLADLQTLANKIGSYYRDADYPLAQAYLPPQEIRDGKVAITINEGTLGALIINNSSKFSSEKLAAIAEQSFCQRNQAQCKGQILTRSAIDNGILILSDLAGLNISASLKPGTDPGTTDLLVDVSPLSKNYSISTGIDNYGNPYIGVNRFKLGLDLNNQFGLAEQIKLREVTTGNGLNSLSADISAPINAYNTNLALTASRLKYQLAGRFSAVGAEGTSETLGLYARHPLVRELNQNMQLQLGVETRRLNDDLGPTVRSRKRTEGLNLILSGDRTSSTNSNLISYELALTNARLGLDSATDSNDRITAKASGKYNKLTYRLNRLDVLTPSLQFYSSANGQLASKNLDASEKISLGGPTGIRAYPAGEAAGDEGGIVSLEFRYTLPTFLPLNATSRVIAFAERGWVKVNKEKWNAYVDASNYSIGAVGLGLTVTTPQGQSLGITWAVPRFASPKASDEKHSRIWAYIGQTF